MILEVSIDYLSIDKLYTDKKWADRKRSFRMAKGAFSIHSLFGEFLLLGK